MTRDGGETLLTRRGWVCDYEAGERPLPPPDPMLRRLRPALLPVSTATSVRTDDRVVALTFDDGPDPDGTPGVLEALARADARATFFVLAERAERHPALLRRIAAEGHEVALHGEDHTRLSTLPAAEAVRRIRRGRRRLEDVLGAPVTLYRPAYGAQRLAQAAGTRALGLDIVVWTAWARDWEAGTATEVAERAFRAVHPGGFLLLHDGTGDLQPTPGPAPTFDRGEVTTLLLERLAGAGYRTGTVGRLMATYPVIRTFWAESAASAAAAADIVTPA